MAGCNIGGINIGRINFSYRQTLWSQIFWRCFYVGTKSTLRQSFVWYRDLYNTESESCLILKCNLWKRFFNVRNGVIGVRVYSVQIYSPGRTLTQYQHILLFWKPWGKHNLFVLLLLRVWLNLQCAFQSIRNVSLPQIVNISRRRFLRRNFYLAYEQMAVTSSAFVSIIL